MKTGHFKKYGKQFQEKIFQALISDPGWSTQMMEIMNYEYFDVKYLSVLSKWYFDYFTKYRTFPSLTILRTIASESLEEKSDGVLKSQILDFIQRTKSSNVASDLPYVKDNIHDFCRKQAMKEALEKAVDLIATDKVESVISVMKEALGAGMPSTTGHDFFEDMEVRFQRIERLPCPTGIKFLDEKDVLNGGLGRGELGVVTANTGVGKSHFLVSVGAEALRMGKNVIHYTFELSESLTGIRYDSNLCDINSKEVIPNKDYVMETYKNSDFGRLIIKEYPTGSASVITLKNHVEKLMLKGFKPSLIIIDYADIMRSTRRYDSVRHELKLIYEELRNLATEINVPVWTASQANRDSANSMIVGLENMSEAYGKAMVADVVLSISRKAAEKAAGTGRIFVAKNRAGRDGLLFPVTIDTAKSRITLREDAEEMTADEVIKNDASEMRSLLKNKWKEIKG